MFGVIYRHPVKNEIKKFQNLFTEFIYKLTTQNIKYFIFGDFNYCLLNNSNSDYVSTLLNMGCKQLIENPTHPNPINDSLIDHLYSNCCDKDISNKLIKENLSDHHVIHTIIQSITLTKNKLPRSRKKRSMKNFDENKFCADLEVELKKLHSTFLQSTNNINHNFEQFLKCLTSITNKHAPLVKMSKKEIKTHYRPWVTKGIIKSYKTKIKLYKTKIKTKTKEDTIKYKKFSNKLTHVKKAAKIAYYKKLFSESSNNPKKTWKLINDLVRYKKTTTNSIDFMKDKNNQIIKDPGKIGDIFNEYFINIGPNLGDSCTVTTNTNHYTSSLISNSFILSPVTITEVNKLLKNLDINKNNGPDELPNKFIKLGHKCIAPILTYLINQCFCKGIFPDVLKISTVIPIHKSGDYDLPTHFRPITLTSIFSKIIERCIHGQLTKFFHKFKLIHDNQYGFQRGLSTEMAIQRVYENLATRLDAKEVSCAIFLDLRKAFDSVNHGLLINKLFRHGIRGAPLKLISSFLENRKQCVFVNGVKSGFETVKCGVPQGSVLGPLLFLCFINDLPKVSSVFETLLFADDACLISSSSSTTTLENQTNSELKQISNWLSYNKLCVNYSKTFFMLFSKRKSKFNLNIIMDNNIINQTDRVKYLGVIFDNKLNWAPHIINVTKKIASGCWAIANLRNFVDIKTLRIVYFSLVHSHLTYGISCYGSASKYLLNKLLVKQKWALKVITRSDFLAPSTPLFYRLKFLKLDDIHKLKIATEIRRLMLTDQLGKFNIQTNQSIHQHTTRSATKGNFAIPMANSNIGKSTLRFKGALIWNSIPDELRNLSINQFKFKYKKLLIELYNE